MGSAQARGSRAKRRVGFCQIKAHRPWGPDQNDAGSPWRDYDPTRRWRRCASDCAVGPCSIPDVSAGCDV